MGGGGVEGVREGDRGKARESNTLNLAIVGVDVLRTLPFHPNPQPSTLNPKP